MDVLKFPLPRGCTTPSFVILASCSAEDRENDIEKRPNDSPEFNKTLGKALLFTTLGQEPSFYSRDTQVRSLSQSNAQRLAAARSEID